MFLTERLEKTRKEESLYNPLKDKLEERGYNVYTNINLASYKYKAYWTKWFGKDIPPLQPQIDLLLVKRDDFSVRAIEVKYFEMQRKRLNQSYYEGIGEAIALMNFGFESVALWHCFDKNVPLGMLNNYATHVANLIATLSLRLDYTCFQVVEENESIFFKTLYTPGAQLFFDDIPKKIAWRQMNPLKYQAQAQKILDFIRHVLRIPSK